VKLIVIESPYAGDVERNVRYARACMRDALERGETPYASHLLFTQDGILDDLKPEERHRGIEAGFAWGEAAGAEVALYIDLGVSKGMRAGAARAGIRVARVHERTLGAPWSEMPSSTRVIPDIYEWLKEK
jgi:hypothetical protein